MRCGIDLGSRSVKIVVFNQGNLVDSKLLETAVFYREFGEASPEGLKVEFSKLGLKNIDDVVATGYGRNTIAITGATVIAELKAHMLGAISQTGLKNFTLLDLGGQDSKVIKVRKGKMVDFDTNDKCAASTGRYLENMAKVLNITVEELSLYRNDPVALNATCAIFGETELIGKIVEGYDTASLAAGVNYSIFKRIKPMLTALKSDTLIFTGGVAFSKAIKEILAEELSVEVIVPAQPQLNGAIGCAVYEK